MRVFRLWWTLMVDMVAENDNCEARSAAESRRNSRSSRDEVVGDVADPWYVV